MADQHTTPARSPFLPSDRRRRKPLLLRTLGVFLRLVGLLLFLLLLLLGFVLGTQTGLRAAVAVAEDLAPDRVSVGRVEGRVLGELSIAELSLNLPGLALDLGRLHLDWHPGALLKGRLRVVDLSASDIDVVTEPSDKEPTDEPFELPDIHLPIEVDIDRVLVERLSIAQKGAPPEAAIIVGRVALSASALSDRVDLRQLAVILTQPEAEANAIGNARLSGDYPLDLALDWRFRQAPSLLLEGKGQVGGSLAELAIEHQISGVAEAELQVEVRDTLKAPSWTADVRLERVDLPAIMPDTPAVDLTADLHSIGDLERAEIQGSLRGAAPALAEAAQLDAELDLLWDDRRLTLTRVRLTEAASGAAVDLDGHVDLAGDTPVVEIRGAWERLRWPLSGDALAESPLGQLDVTGGLDAFDYSLNADVFGEQIPETSLSLKGTGSSEQIRIESLLVEALGGRIEASGTAAWAPAVTWDVALTAADIDPGLQWSGLDGKVSMQAGSSGGLDDGYRFDAEVNAALTAYPPADLVIGGAGDLSRATLDTLTIDALEGRVEGGGQVAWTPAVTWDLDLRADDLDPGKVQDGLDGRVGFELTSAGGLDEGYDVQLQGSAAIADYPPTRIDFAASGDLASAQIKRLDIQVLDGRIQGDGRVAWAPEVGWNATLDLADLDPGTLTADWPGRIGGRVQSSGRLTDAGPQFDALIDQIRGELRGYPVRLDAEVDMIGDRVRLRRLIAGSGTSEAKADGELRGDALSFRFDVDAPDLAALVPDGRGSLSAEGTVSGTLESPRIRADLLARDAAVDAQGIERLTGSLDIALGQPGAFDIDIDGANLIAGGMRFETLAVRGTGSMPSHRLEANLAGQTLGLDLRLEGGLSADGDYAGRLAQLSLPTAEFGTWSLQRPADIGLVQGAVKLGPLCLGNGNESGGCVSYDQPGPGRFEVSLDVDRVGFDILNPLLPELMVMEGYLRAQGGFRGEGNRLAGKATVEIPMGVIEMSLDESGDKLVFSDTRVDVRAGPDSLDADLSMPVPGLGGIDAELTLPGFLLDRGPAQALRGAVRVQLDGLSRISNLVPDIDEVRGNADADLALSGTLGEPDIRARVRVQDLGLNVPLYGFELTGANLTAESTGPVALRIDGGGNIGGGDFEIGGDLDLGGDAPVATVQISGRDLKVADSSEYFALVSLDMQVGAGPAGTAVQGEIDLPQARIKPRTVPTGAVQPSSDVVVEEPGDDDEGAPLSIDLLVKLGDEVSIDAFGLRGLLRGQLRVLKSPQGEILGDGKLQIVDGTYRVTLPTLGVMTAIGKPLTVEQGIVTFAKTPIGNPGLILNAQREGGDVTAGVRVLGTLRNPKLAFFSESDPNLTQAEITRYLVTGIPPGRDGDAGQRALAVGTYVAPKLYVEYESGTADAQDAVKMRYDLNKWIEIQTETGDSQGADIFFKFEN